MPHAHHFLERLDRVTRAHTEFLLNLYRDDEALKYILSHVNVPEGTQRLALSVDDPREGPFAIVSRDGHFITCLGYGMHQDNPVVTRGQLDALLAHVADKRERREIARRELRPDEDDDDLLQRIFSRGRRLAREDYVAVTAFENMLGMAPFLIMVDIAAEAAQLRLAIAPGSLRVVVKGSSIKVLEKVDRFEWATAHLMLLVGSAERRDLQELLDVSKRAGSSPTYLCAAQGGTTWFLRAAWAASKLGKAALGTYKSCLGTAADWAQILDAAFGAATIALRHSALEAEVRRFLEGYKAQAQNPDNDLLDAGRAMMAGFALSAFEDPDGAVERILDVGRKLCVEFGQHLEAGHPLRFDAPEAVPVDLARTAALSIDGDSGDDAWVGFLAQALPLVARASAEDFYFPREVVRAWFGAWEPEEQLERLKRVARKLAKKEPVRAASKVGRNDPCTCGSGKKWKKCHGASGPS